MRRIFPGHCVRHSLAAAIAAFAFTSFTGPAFANDYGDSHCFPAARTVSAPVIHAEEDYANGRKMSAELIAAVEAAYERRYAERLRDMPLEDLRRNYLEYAREHEAKAQGNGHGHHYYWYQWYGAWNAAALERESERLRRRTGSKYMFVTPEQHRLARDRAELRALKRKPCNPHITYLGG